MGLINLSIENDRLKKEFGVKDVNNEILDRKILQSQDLSQLYADWLSNDVHKGGVNILIKVGQNEELVVT